MAKDNSAGGAVVGAGIGLAVGGPLGAVIGGVIGAIAGSDSSSSSNRPLSKSEERKMYAKRAKYMSGHAPCPKGGYHNPVLAGKSGNYGRCTKCNAAG